MENIKKKLTPGSLNNFLPQGTKEAAAVGVISENSFSTNHRTWPVTMARHFY
jgi:hypothetical protein